MRVDMRILGALSLVAVASAAWAEPAARSYQQAMAEGARRMAAKDFSAAVAAFRAALAVRADDARALSELSVASFSAGDFVAAKHAASSAAYEAHDPRLRAMAYYNAGRAAEAQHK